jgi:hypothetical protein
MYYSHDCTPGSATPLKKLTLQGSKRARLEGQPIVPRDVLIKLNYMGLATQWLPDVPDIAC